MAICGVWEKQSYKRYSTSVGGLHIEVVRWEEDAAEKVALKYLAAVGVGLKYRPWR